MAEATNYQCPNCSGRLGWNGEIGKLQCEFCESTFTPEEVEALYAQKQAQADARVTGGREQEVAAETGGTTSAAAASTAGAAHVEVKHSDAADPVQAYLEDSRRNAADIESLRAYNCPSCGAQLMVDQVTAVTSCPYCGNNAVVPGQLSDVLKPDFVIPFKLDKNAAIAALKRYYQGKKLLPNNFTDTNHIEEIQGVYVPFWLYSGIGEGSITMNGRNVRTWMDKHNVYTETDHYLLHRAGHMGFNHVPVDGSTKMPDAHMDAIEPYDYSEMVPFSVAYLPGYLTDRYDQDAKTCEKRAGDRVCNTVADELQKTATGYMEVDLADAESTLNLSQVAYALLPVWMLHTRWNGNDYLFAMNGQTGRLVGDLPVDTGKAIRRFLLIFLPLAVICFVLVYFFMGF